MQVTDSQQCDRIRRLEARLNLQRNAGELRQQCSQLRHQVRLGLLG